MAVDEHPAQLAAARSLAYGLLADLLTRGLTPETREAALASEPIRAAIFGRAGDLDALAVEHEHAFGWSTPPFEGAFLDPSRTIGGAGGDALWALFRASGFVPRKDDAEHLASALRCLAFLSGAEADALEDHHAGAVERVRTLSRRLLDEHVLRYLPVLASAVRRTGLAFPTALVDELEPLAMLHRRELPGDPSTFALPEPPPLLEREETGLREIAEYLATPALSGLVIGKDDLTRIGRSLRVPRGFGDRTQVLLNLLRAAVQYEVLDEVMVALADEARGQREALSAPRYASVAAFTSPWRARLEQTEAAIAQIRDDARRFDEQSDEPRDEPRDEPSDEPSDEQGAEPRDEQPRSPARATHWR